MIVGPVNTTHKCNPIWQHECEEGKCIRKYSVCNGKSDCSTGSDESDELCHNRVCDDDAFKCKNGQCIQSEFRCDRNYECFDKSDEMNCSTGKTKSI